MTVFQIFQAFCNNLTINNKSDISARYQTITKRLNQDFWNSYSLTSHSLYVGSYGRKTAIRGFSDLDMLFVLPSEMYHRYDNFSGNGQSCLLQAIRNSLLITYSTTHVRGDGQVIVVPFSDNMMFEVVPAFALDDGSHIYPDSNGGGQWRKTNPIPEISAIQASPYSQNLKWLCRMTRAWKNHCNVPMGGLLIDTLCYRFINGWKYREQGKSHYHWMCRDFFEFLMTQDPEQQYWKALGSGQYIYRKGKFEYKAKLAFNKSVDATNNQMKKYWYTAKSIWREIYGYKFPR